MTIDRTLAIALAIVAGVNPPSAETIRLVRHFFAERARWTVADPFEGLC